MTVTLRRTVHVEHCMGTVFSIDIRDPGDWTDAVADVVARLHHADRVFSTYRPDSDLDHPRPGRTVGEVRDPELVRPAGPELPVDKIDRSGRGRVSDRGAHPSLLAEHTGDAHLSHEPFHGAAGDLVALRAQPQPHLASAQPGDEPVSLPLIRDQLMSRTSRS